MLELKVGVIGCGSHAESHFQEIADEPRLHLAAIAEIDPERRERAVQKHEPDASFDDYQDMLQKTDLDVVYVETLPGHLLPIVLACLDEGINTSIEKSPGMNSRETQAMAEAARTSKGKAMVSFNRRYFPEVLAVRQKVQERGGAVDVGATYNKPLSQARQASMTDISPDPIIGDAIHHVDLLRWLAGPSEGEAARAVEVYATVQDGVRPGSHRHNAAIRFDSGAIGSMVCHYGVGFRIQRAEAHAEDLSFYLDLTTRDRRIEYYTAGDSGSEAEWIGRPVKEALDLDSVGGPGYNETRHFVDCILEDRMPWSNLDDAVNTMKLCEAIRRGHKGDL